MVCLVCRLHLFSYTFRCLCFLPGCVVHYGVYCYCSCLQCGWICITHEVQLPSEWYIWLWVYTYCYCSLLVLLLVGMLIWYCSGILLMDYCLWVPVMDISSLPRNIVDQRTLREILLHLLLTYFSKLFGYCLFLLDITGL